MSTGDTFTLIKVTARQKEEILYMFIYIYKLYIMDYISL